MPETVYSAESELLRPGRLFRAMLQDLRDSRELAWRLFLRDLSAQHRQTLLGYVWVFLPPLVTTLIWVFLQGQGIIRTSPTGAPYPVFVLSGLLLWTAFVGALNSPQAELGAAAAMLTKIKFPCEALFLAGLGKIIFHTLIQFLLLLALVAWYQMPIPPTAWLAPVGVLALMALGFTFGLFVAPLGMLYHDVSRAVGAFVGVWFFLTPVVYPAPTSWPASLIARINPVSPLLITTREWLTTGEPTHLGSFFVICALTVVGLIVSWVLFRIASPHLIARMNA